MAVCGHVFCYQCVSNYLTGEDNTCPAPGCKEQLGADVVYSRPALQRCIPDHTDGDSSTPEVSDKSMVLQSDYMSSKIKAALEIISLHCITEKQYSEAPNIDANASSSGALHLLTRHRVEDKAIIFSQWTSMLDLLESSLKDFGINYRRLDGTMSIASRDKAVKEFNADPEVEF